MRRRGLIAVCLMAPLAGCGGSGSKHAASSPSGARTSATGGHAKRFNAAGIELHFSYPRSFHAIRLAAPKRLAGNTAGLHRAAIGIGHYDLIGVTRFPKRPIPVTAQNISALKDAFDGSLSTAFGQKLGSTVTTVGGLPALSYPPVSVAGLPVHASSRVTLVFIVDDEYELNCQATDRAKAAVGAACDQMLATLSG